MPLVDTEVESEFDFLDDVNLDDPAVAETAASESGSQVVEIADEFPLEDIELDFSAALDSEAEPEKGDDEGAAKPCGALERDVGRSFSRF